jgi:hypothetical protein
LSHLRTATGPPSPTWSFAFPDQRPQSRISLRGHTPELRSTKKIGVVEVKLTIKYGSGGQDTTNLKFQIGCNLLIGTCNRARTEAKRTALVKTTAPPVFTGVGRNDNVSSGSAEYWLASSSVKLRTCNLERLRRRNSPSDSQR